MNSNSSYESATDASPIKVTHLFCQIQIMRLTTIALYMGSLLTGCSMIGCETPCAKRNSESRITPGTNHSWSRLPTKNSDTTFIFVHGFLSDSSCWLYKDPCDGNKDAYWPQILANDSAFDNCGIYLAGYGTSLGSGKYSVSDAVVSMQKHLNQSPESGEPRPLESSNIVFIAHSLGGIVIRDLLTKNPEDFEGKKVGLLLVASPSLGSNYAVYLKALSKLYKNDMATNLEKSDERLTQLDYRFRSLNGKSSKKRGFCLLGVELLESKFILGDELSHLIEEVVPEETLGQYWSNPERIKDTDHFSIVKPSSAKGEVHVYLRDFWNSFKETECGEVLPPVIAPLIQEVRADFTLDEKDLNVKIIFERPKDIPSHYKLRFEFSDNGSDWDGGRLDSNQSYELDSSVWPGLVEPVPDPGYSCGSIRTTVKFVRISVVSPKQHNKPEKIVASSAQLAVQK